MKKKILFFSFLVLIIIAGFVLFFVFKNKTVSTIYLDINPSIKIELTRDEKIKKITPLNDDAKKVVNNSLINKSLEYALKTITYKIIENDFIENNSVVVLLYSTGTIKNENIQNTIKKEFTEKNFFAQIIVVDSISSEDEELAKKYNITPSKAAYINSILKENEKINVEYLKEKSVKELEDTKEKEIYCTEEYFLDGDHCFKEIRRENAIMAEVCPSGYFEYNNICYEESPAILSDNLICRSEFSLKDNNCVREIVSDAIPLKYSCKSGELMSRRDVGLVHNGENGDYVCVDKSKAKAPVLRCLTINHTMIDGKCYVGPAPTINGGCPNNDKLVKGGCYSLDDGDQWVCTDGRIYEKSKNSVPKYCPETVKYTNPTVLEYKCEGEETLNNNKCIRTEIEPPENEKSCSNGFTLVDNNRCINKNKTVAKQDGYKCKVDNSKLKGNICVIYDIIEAFHG